MARFFPGANASVSVMVIRPSRRSATRLRRPSATLPPPVSNALRRAAGFVGRNKVGLVEAVGQKDATQLRSALERLKEAGLLSQQGVPPHASYLFKHALVQDAAYGTLL